MNSTSKIVDLTHSLSDSLPVYPGDPIPKIDKIASVDRQGYSLSKLDLHSHLGTHIDAPSHILDKGKNLEEYELNHFIGKGICIECTAKPKIELSDMPSAEKLQQVDFVLLYTGYDQHWGKDKYYSDFPVLVPEAAVLLSSSKLKGMGIDCPSFDFVNGELHNHLQFLSNDVLLIENLCNLQLLLEHSFNFFCIPLKFDAADGSPVRAFGEITN